MTDPNRASDSRLARALPSAAAVVLAGGIVLRWCISGGVAGSGVNLFVHAVLLAGGLLWAAHAALEGRWTLRFSGAALPLALFAILGLLTFSKAAYKSTALDHACAYGTYAILYVLLLNLFATRRHLLLTTLFGFVFVVAAYSIVQRFVVLPEIRSIADPRRASPEFEARLQSNEVWGTFFYPNSLAGFLALTLPMLAGFTLDARRRWAPIVGVVTGALCLIWTGSAGGWVAAAAGFALFGGLLATRDRPALRRWLWIGSGIAAATIVALVIAGPLSPKRIPHESMRIRSVYWSAATKIFPEHPMLGVGLDNFQEYYSQYKGDTQQETNKVHNDYLQVLVDLGAVGLLLFLAFLGWVLGHGVRPRVCDPPPLDTTARDRWMLATTGVAAIFLARVLAGTFGDYWIELVVAVGAWIGYVGWIHPIVLETASGPLEHTRLGAMAGFGALLVHMGVDFDFYEFGLSMTLVLVAALLAILGGRTRAVAADRAPGIAAFAFFLLVLAAPLYFLPRLLEADQKKSEGLQLMTEARAKEDRAKALEGAGRMAEARTARVEAATSYSQAMEAFLDGQRLNVLDGDPFLQHAALCEILWDQIRAQGSLREGEIRELQIQEQIAVQALHNALTIRSRWAAAHARLGALHRKFASFYEELSTRGDLYRRQAETHRKSAVEHSLRAAELYPTRAEARYWAARTLDEGPPLGDPRIHYAEALRFSELAERERLERLQLNVFQKARALTRLDRAEEAKALLRGFLVGELRRTNPGPMQQRQAIEALLGRQQSGHRIREFAGDEYDGLMKPVIDGILLDMLSALPKE